MPRTSRRLETVLFTSFVVATAPHVCRADQVVPVKGYGWVYAFKPDLVSINYHGGQLVDILPAANLSPHILSSFLTFDLTGVSLPAGSTATLHLLSTPDNGGFYTPPGPANPATILVQPLTASFDPSTLTYSNQPGVASDTALWSSFVCDDVQKDFAVDVTAMVSAWTSGALVNSGLRLSVSSFALAAPAFTSGSDGQASPFIVIQSVPEPGAMTAGLLLAMLPLTSRIRRR